MDTYARSATPGLALLQIVLFAQTLLIIATVQSISVARTLTGDVTLAESWRDRLRAIGLVSIVTWATLCAVLILVAILEIIVIVAMPESFGWFVDSSNPTLWIVVAAIIIPLAVLWIPLYAVAIIESPAPWPTFVRCISILKERVKGSFMTAAALLTLNIVSILVSFAFLDALLAQIGLRAIRVAAAVLFTIACVVYYLEGPPLVESSSGPHSPINPLPTPEPTADGIV